MKYSFPAFENGFIRAAAASPALRVADCTYNADQIIAKAKEAAQAGAKLAAFPELCLTGYTCGDLFLQETLLRGAEEELVRILNETADLSILVIVGLPYASNGAVYNCAAVCCQGKLLGMVPKQNLPNYSEFYEARHFTPGPDAGTPAEMRTLRSHPEYAFPFGAKLLFSCAEMPDFTFGVEICEDVWVADTPSVTMARSGAALIVNLSCSDEIIGKEDYRRTILKAKSGSLLCAYAYADAGFGESTQDMVFAGHDLILENGSILAESKLFARGILYGDIDVQRLAEERRRSNTFQPIAPASPAVPFSMELTESRLDRFVDAAPFVPSNKEERTKLLENKLKITTQRQSHMMRHISSKHSHIVIS